MALLLKRIFINLKILNNVKEVRTYARWTHRRPRRILTTEELNDSSIIKSQDEQTTQVPVSSLKSKWIPKGVKPLSIPEQLNKTNDQKKIKINTPTKETTDMLDTIIDAEGNLVYSKLRNNDPTISQLLIMVKSRRQQIKQDLALLEGKRLIKEALEAKCTLKNIIFSQKKDVEDLKPYLPKTGARIVKMPYKEIQTWSNLTTTPGIMGIFKTPQVENYISHHSLPITVICDNIREPGNLGAILRTAAGVGIRSVILTKGCVDLWDTKVLRSACGAHFHLKIFKKMNWESIKQHLETSKSTAFIADNKIVSETMVNKGLSMNLKDIILSIPLLPYYGIRFNDYQSLALIIGGETEGISEESFQIAASLGGIRLNIPMNNYVESLNVGTALGIILFEMKRQLLLSVNSNVNQSFALN